MFICGNSGEEVLVGLEYSGIAPAYLGDYPRSGGRVAREIRYLREIVERIVIGGIVLR